MAHELQPYWEMSAQLPPSLRMACLSLSVLFLVVAKAAASIVPPFAESTEVIAETVSERSVIVQAIDANQAKAVQAWLQKRHSPLTRIRDQLHERLLDRAAMHASVDVFALLIQSIRERKLKLNLRNSMIDARGTPLLVNLTALAVETNPQHKKYESMIENLLALDPLNVNAVDHAYIGDGRTALHQAAAVGNASVMNLLIKYGANVNQKNTSGETPLHLAARFGHTEAAQILLLQGAKMNEQTFYTRQTPLMIAAEMGQKDVIRMLLLRGADRQIKDTFGKTAPERYIEYGMAFNAAKKAKRQ